MRKNIVSPNCKHDCENSTDQSSRAPDYLIAKERLTPQIPETVLTPPDHGAPSDHARANRMSRLKATAWVSGDPFHTEVRRLRGARVTLSQIIEAPARQPANAPGRTVVTTADGGYAFRNLGAGRYTINASKRGYLSGGVGARRPGGRRQLLVLVEGETVNASAITLWKDAAISGLVLDEGGEPVVGARVRALRQTPPRGAEFGGESWTTTDDRGSYRLSGVPPGDYLVVVSSILLDGSLIYPLTFYLSFAKIRTGRATVDSLRFPTRHPPVRQVA
jgi:hypothetical protein